MHGMTTGLAREFARDGITVNTVAPCAIVTPQYRDIEKSNPELIEKVVSVIPMGRAGTEEEVASMAAYLARDEASFVTGQGISVNGGTTMLCNENRRKNEQSRNRQVDRRERHQHQK